MSARPDDSALVARVRAGDDAAFAELWRAHAEAATRFAVRLTRTIDPDDLVAEAYTRILAALRAGRGPQGPFRPYLVVTIRNIAVSWSRGVREDPLDEAEAIPDPAATDAAVVAASNAALTMQALRTLPERWQRVLWLSEVDGMPPQEIAAELGMAPNGAAALAYRAREGLRQAWIQAHVDSSAADSEHRWVLERVGKWARGGLTERDRNRAEAHLADCPACTVIAVDARDGSARLTASLLPLAVGLTAAGPTGAPPVDEPPEDGNDDRAAVLALLAGVADAEAAGDRRRRLGRRHLLLAVLVLLLSAVGVLAWGRDGSSGARALVSGASIGPVPTAVPSAEPGTGPESGPPPDAAEEPAPAPEPAPTPAPAAAVEPAPAAGPADVPPAPAPVAAAPAPTVIAAADTADRALFPVLTGTAEPGAVVTLTGRGGTLATVTADGAGRWQAGPLTGVPSGTSTITASSGGSTTSVSVTVRQPIVSTSLDGDSVTVHVSGIPGAVYSATWDGAALGSSPADGAGAATISGPVTPTGGDHAVRVQAVAGARTGPATTVTVRW